MIDPPTHSSFNPSTHSLTNQPIYSPTNPLIHPPTHSVILHSYNDPQLSYPNIQQSILPSPRTYPFIHGQTKPGHITLIWSTMWHIHSPNHTMCLWYRSTALTQTSVPVVLGLTHSSPHPLINSSAFLFASSTDFSTWLQLQLIGSNSSVYSANSLLPHQPTVEWERRPPGRFTTRTHARSGGPRHRPGTMGTLHRNPHSHPSSLNLNNPSTLNAKW